MPPDSCALVCKWPLVIAVPTLHEPPDTCALTGAFLTGGVLATTEARDSALITATIISGVKIAGLLLAESADTAAVAGRNVVSVQINAQEAGDGSLGTTVIAAIEAVDSIAVAGTLVTGDFTAVMALLEARDNAALAGGNVVTAQIAAIERADGRLLQTTVAATEAADAVTMQGVLITPTKTATLALAEAADSSAVAGLNLRSGSLVLREVADSAALTAVSTRAAQLAVLEVRDSVALTGTATTSVNPPSEFTTTEIPFNYSGVVCLKAQYATSRYERFQNHCVITSNSILLPFSKTNLEAGGSTAVSFLYPKYGLVFTPIHPTTGALVGPGVERATYTRVGSERTGSFVGTLGSEPDGPTRVEIVAYDANNNRVISPVEGLLTYWLYIDRASQARNHAFTVFQNGSYEWEKLAADGHPVVYQFIVVPKASLANTAPPLTPITAVPFDTALPKEQIVRTNYVPFSQATPHRPCITKRGITITECRQPYFWVDAHNSYSRLPLRDGPRGEGTAALLMHLYVGRLGKIYGADPFSFWVIDSTGLKRTLVGQRHIVEPYWAENGLNDPNVEYVGNWDPSIPLYERFPWESWGRIWDPDSLLLDEDDPPIGGEQPHVGIGPVIWLTDRHGYVLKVQFDGHNRMAPAVVTRLLPADDPWGIDYADGVIYVGERGVNRISKWDEDGNFLGVLVGDPTASALGSIDDTVRMWIGATAAVCRTHSIVAPEGMRIQDGFMYWGSLAQREVRRIPLAGGPIEVVCRPNIDNNSNYVFIELSDGTFGPRGTVFVTTWSATNNGRPQAFLPIPGVATDGTPLRNSVVWAWQSFAEHEITGPGGKWDSGSYGGAVGIGHGMLVCGGADNGIDVYTKKTTNTFTVQYSYVDSSGNESTKFSQSVTVV